jgi:hypothetical protein
VPNQRVLFLKFLHEKDRNAFFWIQEADAAGDERLQAAAHKAINTMPGGCGLRRARGLGVAVELPAAWRGGGSRGAAGCRLQDQWQGQ